MNAVQGFESVGQGQHRLSTHKYILITREAPYADGGSMFLWHVNIYIQVYVALFPEDHHRLR